MSRFFFLLLVCFSIASFEAQADNSEIYTVSGILVNSSGKSPAIAKSTAHATARREAFLVLLARLEMRNDVADSVTDDEIADMVRSEQIESEKISGNNYSATFNIVFAKDFVEHILNQKNSSEAVKEGAGEAFLLIPVVMKKHQPLLWGEDNDWKKSITKVLQKNSQNKFVIPEADIANVATIDEKNIANLDYSIMEPVLSRYKANVAYTLIFSYDEIENKVLVRVIRISRLQKKQVKLSFVNINRLGYEELMDKVADKTISYLAKSQEDPDKVSNSGLIKMKVYINSLGSWLAAKNNIERSNLINQLNIESISHDYVVITVRYIGYKDVREAFATKGINLTQMSENYYALNAN